jgi:inner membrane protein
MENHENTNFFQTTTAKMIMVGILTLVLLVPLQYVKSLIEERSKRQKEVVTEINQKWGESIYFYGPIIKVPYLKSNIIIKEENVKSTVSREEVSEDNFIYFFPNNLKNAATITMKKPLKRNNYESIVFTSEMKFSGNYETNDLKLNTIPAENIMWNKASVIIKTNNLKSIKEEVKIKIGNKNYVFEPVYNTNPNDSIEALETDIIDFGSILNDTNISFQFNLTYDGSEQIKMVPIGKTTEVMMNSNWNSPSFIGNFLPNDNKKITAKGFDANWKILHINRPFSQHFVGYLPDLRKYSFGVDFIIPVDEYLQNDRASKYGFLVIGLTFLIFFLIQSISKKNIHIFQYSMIGLALILFYTLLISITEHSSFTKAYLISASSVIVMIGLYSVSILKDKKFPLFIGLSLTALYSFIFVIIQMENYALLVGSIGLFLILGAVMYFSRKIDWGK